MRWSTIAASLALAAACGAMSAPAQAQTRERVAQNAPQQGTVFRSRDEDGRVRTRVIVQRRSYLDGGTEVLPGERKYQDYAFPPGYSPTQAFDNTTFTRDRQTLPGPFTLPSKNNPMQ